MDKRQQLLQIGTDWFHQQGWEVQTFQLEEARLRAALNRINAQKILLQRPDQVTPFSFPIIVDRQRERLSSEKLADRIKRMTVEGGRPRS